MKRKCKNVHKGHTRRNARIKRRKRTRRQRGGAYIENVDLRDTDLFPIDKQRYNVIESDYYENGSIMYSLECKAKAIVLHAGPHCESDGSDTRCPPRFQYEVLDGPVIFKTYQPDGTLHFTYVGHFESGKMHGHGTLTFHTHPVFQEYEGDFEDGEMHGTGKMIMKNGDAYDGEFQHDLMHGKGTMMFHDGSRYEGDWEQGQMHGMGNVHDDKGNFYSARFINNEPRRRRRRRRSSTSII